MERLTKKDGANRNFVDVKRFDDDEWIISEMADGVTIKFSSRAIDKLAEFEDFMEEQGFESLEELKAFVINTKQNEEPYITIDGDLLKKNLKDALDKHYRRW